MTGSINYIKYDGEHGHKNDEVTLEQAMKRVNKALDDGKLVIVTRNGKTLAKSLVGATLQEKPEVKKAATKAIKEELKKDGKKKISETKPVRGG